MSDFNQLSSLQKIRIVQQVLSCVEECYVLDILNDEEIWEQIRQHPDWLQGCKETDPYIWKDLMNNAEYEVKAEWAFCIYKAVKGVLERVE